MVLAITITSGRVADYLGYDSHLTQGRIQDFLKGGSESGVDIEGGANPSIVFLKQGVWGAQPPRSYAWGI